MLFNRKPDHSSHFDLAGVRMPESLPSADQARAAFRAQNGSATQPGSATQSVIDAWLTITGTLESEGDVRVEGQIKGDIRCAHLVVGRDATVSGDIIAEEAVVRGKVRGSIRASRVILQDSACVESDIYHKTLSIDEGASFDGQSCHRQHPFQESDADNAESQPGGMQREAAAVESVERANGPVAEDALRSLGA
jgi:cytoskeletal protein CcmA (bactofilin family)